MNRFTIRAGLTFGGSLWAIGNPWGGTTAAIAQSAPIEPEYAIPAALDSSPSRVAPTPPEFTDVGAMLPQTTIATVIADTAGDWTGMNQFDVLPEPIDGLNQFPHIPTLPDHSLTATLTEWAGDHIALAWLASDRVEDGSYGITIAPLASSPPASSNAQRYREAIADHWRSLNATTEIHTDRGVEILVLFELPPIELMYFDFNPSTNPPIAAPHLQPNEATPPPTVPPSDAVNEPNWPTAPELEPGSVLTPETTGGPMPLPAPRSQYAIAQLADRLLFASQPEAISAYLDAIEWTEPLPIPLADPLSELSPEPMSEVIAPSLGEHSAFQRMIARAPDTAAAIVYADMPRVFQALDRLPLFATPTPEGTDPPTNLTISDVVEHLDVQISTFDGFLWFEPSGARMQFRAHYTTPQSQLAALARSDHETLQHIPAASAFALTTRGFNVILPDLLTVYDAIPALHDPLDQTRRRVREATGFDLDTEILPLLDGDASLFVFPIDPSTFSIATLTPLGVGMTIETSDRPRLETIITRLEQLWAETLHAQTQALKNTGLTVTEVDGFDVTSWNLPSPFNGATHLLSHTWVSDDTLLITAGANVMADLLPVPYQSLTDSYTYQSAIAPFPQPNISLFHANVGSMLSLLNAYFPLAAWNLPNTMFDVAHLLQSLRSVSESTTATENYAQDDIHIQLAPRRSSP